MGARRLRRHALLAHGHDLRCEERRGERDDQYVILIVIDKMCIKCNKYMEYRLLLQKAKKGTKGFTSLPTFAEISLVVYLSSRMQCLQFYTASRSVDIELHVYYNIGRAIL